MLQLPGDLHWSIRASDRPRGTHLAQIEARREALRSFPPAPEGVRKAMISRLFLRFPQMARASEEQVTAYARDLAAFPAWAISKGLMDIVAGLVMRTPEFAPSSLQVREAVEARAAPVREELAAIDGLLGAHVVPDADARVPLGRRRELAEEARQAMRTGAPVDPPPRPRDTRMRSRFDEAPEAYRSERIDV